MQIDPTTSTMTREERRAAITLAGVYSLRMFGLFMILPVFALYAESLTGVTPLLMGTAMGIYGLTQTVLQIPFGMASDRVGRKPVIAAGLVIFAMGSIVAAMSTTIYGVIFGRALQGAGAVAAAVMALAADLTREEHRTKTMAFIGMSIGLSFMAAMVTGPIFSHWIGVPGIFWLTAVLAVGGIMAIYFVVPDPKHEKLHRDMEPVPAQFRRVLSDPQLLRINFGIFALHLVLLASFMIIPKALIEAGLTPAKHGYLYFVVMALSMALAVPFIILGEKRRILKQVVSGAVVLLVVSMLGFAEVGTSLFSLALLLLLFFVAFNLLEATMPSLIAKMAPVESKGTAMGVYSSSQFFGAFIGAQTAGWLLNDYGPTAVFLFCAAVLSVWAALALTMRQPRYLSTHLINLGPLDPVRAAEIEMKLTAIEGVAEVTVNVEDGIAYLKVDSHAVDAAALNRFATATA
jgi:MFS family permease